MRDMAIVAIAIIVPVTILLVVALSLYTEHSERTPTSRTSSTLPRGTVKNP
jgi:hypothetical protein